MICPENYDSPNIYGKKKRSKIKCLVLDEKTIEAWWVKQQFTQREKLKIEGNQASGILVARRYFLPKHKQLISLPSVERSSYNHHPLTGATFRFFIFIFMSPYCRINHMSNCIRTPPSPPWQPHMLQLPKCFWQRSRAQTRMTRKVSLFFSIPEINCMNPPMWYHSTQLGECYHHLAFQEGVCEAGISHIV